MEYFIFGMLFGYILYPIQKIFNKIFKEAWYSHNNCTGDCNQGRNCTCRVSKE